MHVFCKDISGKWIVPAAVVFEKLRGHFFQLIGEPDVPQIFFFPFEGLQKGKATSTLAQFVLLK